MKPREHLKAWELITVLIAGLAYIVKNLYK